MSSLINDADQKTAKKYGYYMNDLKNKFLDLTYSRFQESLNKEKKIDIYKKNKYFFIEYSKNNHFRLPSHNIWKHLRNKERSDIINITEIIGGGYSDLIRAYIDKKHYDNITYGDYNYALYDRDINMLENYDRFIEKAKKKLGNKFKLYCKPVSKDIEVIDTNAPPQYYIDPNYPKLLYEQEEEEDEEYRQLKLQGKRYKNPERASPFYTNNLRRREEQKRNIDNEYAPEYESLPPQYIINNSPPSYTNNNIPKKSKKSETFLGRFFGKKKSVKQSAKQSTKQSTKQFIHGTHGEETLIGGKLKSKLRKKLTKKNLKKKI